MFSKKQMGVELQRNVWTPSGTVFYLLWILQVPFVQGEEICLVVRVLQAFRRSLVSHVSALLEPVTGYTWGLLKHQSLVRLVKQTSLKKLLLRWRYRLKISKMFSFFLSTIKRTTPYFMFACYSGPMKSYCEGKFQTSLDWGWQIQFPPTCIVMLGSLSRAPLRLWLLSHTEAKYDLWYLVSVTGVLRLGSTRRCSIFIH